MAVCEREIMMSPGEEKRREENVYVYIQENERD